MEIIRVRNDHLRARTGRDVAGDQLGRHAAGAEAGSGRALGHVHEMAVQALHLGNELRIRVGARIVRVETVDVREKDQQVRLDEGHHNRGEAVVVTEFDVIGGDGVIFIDDRDRAEFKELVEGVAGVPAALGVRDGLLVHEDLGDRLAVLRKKLLVNAHQHDLADGCAGLLLLQSPAFFNAS